MAICRLVLFAIALICIMIMMVRAWLVKEQYTNLPPGTMGWPIIGETIAFTKEKAEYFKKKHRQYGRIYKTRLFGKSIIRVSGSKNLRKIIKGENTLVQSSYPTSVQNLIGLQSISMCHGDEHKQRKCILKNYLSVEFCQVHIPALTKIIVDRIHSWCEKDHIDLYMECRKLFIELSARFLINIDMTTDEITELTEELDIFTNNIFSLPVNCPGFGYYKAYQAKLRMKRIISRALKRDHKNNSGETSVFQSLKASYTCLHELGREELYLDSVIDLLFSGSESVSSAGFSLAQQLCRKPDVRNKLLSNIKNLDASEVISAHDLHAMPYLRSVVMETLRMLPPIGGAYRTALQSFELDGYTVPKGWTIVFSIRDTHQEDPEVLNPMEFNPDHWTQPDFGKDKYSFVPFGSGARICPGQAYTKMVLKIFAVEFTRWCYPNIIQDSELDFWPTPRPVNVVLVNVSKVM